MAYPVGLITTNSDGLWLNHSGNQDTFVQTYPGSPQPWRGIATRSTKPARGTFTAGSFRPTPTDMLPAVIRSCTPAYCQRHQSAGLPQRDVFRPLHGQRHVLPRAYLHRAPAQPLSLYQRRPGYVPLRRRLCPGRRGSRSLNPDQRAGRVVPIDLALDTDYQIVMRYELDNNRCASG